MNTISIADTFGIHDSATAVLAQLTFIRNRQLMAEKIKHLMRIPASFPWDQRRAWGVEDDAWQYTVDKQINPLLIFCHPRALSEQPRLLLYYRTVNLISQKGLSALVGGNVAKIETGKVDKIDRDWLAKVVVALNSIASVVLKNSAEIDACDLPGFQFATAGASIQGSWNNAIGAEGEAAVKTVLINHLRDEIAQIVWRDGSTQDYTSDLHSTFIDGLGDIRVVRLRQEFHLLFASEPDVSLRDPKDIPLVAVEVKAGADPAGALERLGAALKSFESDRDLNPRVKTVYVVRCMTPELQSRINQGGFFDHTYALSDLMLNDKRQKSFANLFVRVVLDKKRSPKRGKA